jgi:hypothetical protein
MQPRHVEFDRFAVCAHSAGMGAVAGSTVGALLGPLFIRGPLMPWTRSFAGSSRVGVAGLALGAAAGYAKLRDEPADRLDDRLQRLWGNELIFNIHQYSLVAGGAGVAVGTALRLAAHSSGLSALRGGFVGMGAGGLVAGAKFFVDHR